MLLEKQPFFTIKQTNKMKERKDVFLALFIIFRKCIFSVYLFTFLGGEYDMQE